MSDEKTNPENLVSATILVQLRNSKGDFHEYASKNAMQLSLTGYSQDLSDGLYKVFVEGEKSSIQSFIGYMEMNKAFAGMDKIDVGDIMVSWSSHTGSYSDFSIKE
jgi:acylphosphatase